MKSRYLSFVQASKQSPAVSYAKKINGGGNLGFKPIPTSLEAK